MNISRQLLQQSMLLALKYEIFEYIKRFYRGNNSHLRVKYDKIRLVNT